MTFSIVARDEDTGEIGVAVQSHYFSVGSVVPWARAGVGAVATQAMVDVRYGPLGLEMMSQGKSARKALDSLLESDEKRETRQVAMVDRKGRVAVHTGSKCIPEAGGVTGDGLSCQGNIMRSSRVWGKMKVRFERSRSLPLPERLVAALEAGEEAGGDLRGKQSAALLVVKGKAEGNRWEGKVVDLRVEDHPDPIPELKRLLRYQRGYDWVSKGDDLLTSEKYGEALEAYRNGVGLVPEVLELKYWAALSMLKTKERVRGVKMLRTVFAEDNLWIGLTRRMIESGAISLDDSQIEELLG